MTPTPTRFRAARLAFFGIVLTALMSAAAAAQQAPPAAPRPEAPIADRLRPYAPENRAPDIGAPSTYSQQRRSIVHHNPYPYPGAYHGDATGGFRNPGGVGRHAEYYPPGDRFQSGGTDPVRVARFDQGGGAPDRQEQIEAYNAGTARYNAIQRHIDRYGSRMYFGYGFGMGGFGGMW